MSISILVAPKRNSITGEGIGIVELDATISESHQAEVEVTEHPVEDGAPVVDHLRPKPETLTIEGFISNTPIESGEVATAKGGYPRDAKEGRASDAFAMLKKIKDAGVLVTVATRVQDYENMALVSLTVPRDAKTGSALRFTASFKQIKKATVAAVALPRITRGSKQVNLGDQNKKLADEITKARARSLLKAGADKLRGNL